jgi:hypothetical protein
LGPQQRNEEQLDPSKFHIVHQAVVLVPSMQQASAFYNASAQQWPTCTKYVVTWPPPNGTVTDTVTGVFNVGGMLTANVTQGNGGFCQRALTVANNVIVDVGVCVGANIQNVPGSAVNIARQIAAKVRTS